MTTLIEILARDKGYSYVIKVKDEYANKFLESLPFNTKLSIWKEEVYFTTPITLNGDKVFRIEPGEVYYWPPEKALCLFYGVSEPYTPVIHVGTLIGPLHYLRCVEYGDLGVVNKHELSTEFSEELKEITRLGYEVATPLNEGIKVITALKKSKNVRIAFTIFKESYGYHLESDAFFKYDESYSTLAAIRKLKDLIRRTTKYLRVDINEDGYVVLTSAVESLNELVESIKELEEVVSIMITS